METDYIMRGYLHLLGSQTHHSGRLVLATTHIFHSCNFLFSDFTLRLFSVLLVLFLSNTPPFPDLVFFNVVNVISSSLFLSLFHLQHLMNYPD